MSDTFTVCNYCEGGRWWVDGEEITWFSKELETTGGDLRNYYVCDKCRELILGVVNDKNTKVAKT